MKLEVNKTYLNSFDQKVKIIGKDGNIYFGLTKRDTNDKFSIMVDEKVQKYYESGEVYFKVGAGHYEGNFDLIREYVRDPIVIKTKGTLKQIVKDLKAMDQTNTQFEVTLKEIMG